MMPITYSVALCTHNHAERIVRTLDSLALLRTPRAGWELLVVDNACTDATPQLLREFRWPKGWHVRVVREEKTGLSSARNRAIAAAQGEYVIFLDDDETPDPDWLCAYERLIDERHPAAFGGRICVLFEGVRPPWLTDELLGFLGELNRFPTVAPLVDPGTSFYGGNFGFRKDLCKTVGMFNEMLGRKGTDNTGGEEVDFYRRLLGAGFKVWWTPEAIIHHRIQTEKLKRTYFLDLHYRMGRIHGITNRADGSRIPPRYIFGQALRAIGEAFRQWHAGGRDSTVRKEMNVAYFLGQMAGWAFGPSISP